MIDCTRMAMYGSWIRLSLSTIQTLALTAPLPATTLSPILQTPAWAPDTLLSRLCCDPVVSSFLSVSLGDWRAILLFGRPETAFSRYKIQNPISPEHPSTSSLKRSARQKKENLPTAFKSECLDSCVSPQRPAPASNPKRAGAAVCSNPVVVRISLPTSDISSHHKRV